MPCVEPRNVVVISLILAHLVVGLTVSLRQHAVVQKGAVEVCVDGAAQVLAEGCVLGVPGVSEAGDEASAARVELSLESVESVCRFHRRKALFWNGVAARLAVCVAREKFGIASVCKHGNHGVIVPAVEKLTRMVGQQRTEAVAISEREQKSALSLVHMRC